jgi:hypothetical protein
VRSIDPEDAYEEWRLQKEFEEDQKRKAIDKMGTFRITDEDYKQIQLARHDSERVGSPDLQQGEGTHLSDGAAEQSSDRSA